MKFLLDTNACIHCLRRRGNPRVLQRVRAQPAGAVALCSPVTAELYHGARRSAHAARNLAQVGAFVAGFRVLPFDDPAAQEYARVRADLESRGQMIGHFDLMIAAVALAHGLTVVTHNVGEFSRVPGLTIEDWEQP